MIYQARSDLHLLAVVLISENHDDTPAMESLLCEDTLRSHVVGNDIDVWIGDVSTFEAYSASKALQVGRFPFVGVIVYQSSTDRSGMTCVSKMEGLPNLVDMMSFLDSAMEQFGPTLVSLRADRAEQNFSREIRAEQDSAYEISLRTDRERAEKERRELQEEEERKKVAESEKRNKKLWRRRQQAQLKFISEPDGASRTAKISFRMPNGSRMVHKFRSGTEIRDVYNFIDLQLHLERDEIGEDEARQELPADYVHTYDFTLAVPIPREILEPSSKVLEHIKAVYPSGALIVEQTD